MAYPTTLDDFTPHIDGVDDVMADDVNELQTAIEAIEAKLGADSSAVTSSHDYKIAALQTGKQDALAFTPEDVSNKQTDLTASATKYPTVNAVNTGLSGKQDTLAFTPEDSANKETSALDTSTTKYPCNNVVKTAVDAKVSLTDILNSQSTASASSITPTGNYKENEHYVTALADDLTINAPSGTASNGNTLMIRIKDDGTSRALTFNEAFVAVGTTLPTATPISKVIYIGAIYNSTSSKWEVVSVNEEE